MSRAVYSFFLRFGVLLRDLDFPLLADDGCKYSSASLVTRNASPMRNSHFNICRLLSGTTRRRAGGSWACRTVNSVRTRFMARCQPPLGPDSIFRSCCTLVQGNNSKRIAVLAIEETCDARADPRHRASWRLSLPRRPFQSFRRAAASRDLPLYRLPQIERIDLLGFCNLADRCIRADGACRHVWRTQLLPDLRRTCRVGSRRRG